MAEDTDAKDEEGKTLATKWLDTVQTFPLIHWGSIVAGQTLLGTNAVTGIHRFINNYQMSGNNTINSIFAIGLGGIVSLLGSAITGEADWSIKVLKTTANILNAVTDELKDPNIEGIPIHAESESTSKDVEVNKQIVIVQTSAQKDIVVDNAVPQLRTWQIRGYLTSVPVGLEPYLVLKPSLILQKKLLEWYADSRKPVWFKTHDNEFHKVLITHIDTAYDVKALNAMLINVTLTEFKVMKVPATTAAALGLALKSLGGL